MTTVDIIKKYIPLGIGVVILLVTAIVCLFPPFGKMVCEMNSAPGATSISYTYVADFAMWKVNNLKVTEVIHFSNDNDLVNYRQSLEKDKKKYQDLEYYDNEIIVENDTITNIITIDYKNIDRKKLEEIEGNFSGGAIYIYRLKDIYKKNGAACKNV